VHKPKERKERSQKAPPAAIQRQSSAVDVLRSMKPDEDEGTTAPPAADVPVDSDSKTSPEAQPAPQSAEEERSTQ
jgi:hypothetical protein